MRKKNMKIAGIPAGIGLGSLVGLLLSVLGAAATAALVAGEKMAEQQIPYGTAAVLLLGAFGGAFLASAIAGEKRMIVCIGCGIVFYVVLLCVTALFFDGTYENIWETALLVLGSSAAAGLVGMRKNSTSYKRRNRRIRIP